MPKYVVWVGFQGSTYVTVTADSPEQVEALAKAKVEHALLGEIPFDIFVGDPEELIAE